MPKRPKKYPHFVMLRYDWLDCKEWQSLGYTARILFIELLRQYNGYNNGDLSIQWSKLSKRGWKSKDTLNKAMKTLVSNGWVILTRQGGRRIANLYAVTVYGIDECNGKLDSHIRISSTPLNSWKQKIIPNIKEAQRREKERRQTAYANQFN